MARPSKHDGVVYRRTTARSGGCATGIEPGAAAWNRRKTKTGRKHNGNCANGCKPETTIRSILFVGASTLTFNEWADFFFEHYSKPPIRADKTHEVNEYALKNLQPGVRTDEDRGNRRDGDRDTPPKPPQAAQTRAAEIRDHRTRTLKPATVHQEFRVLRRIFSVAVKKKLCPANPCAGVEFPVMFEGCSGHIT